MPTSRRDPLQAVPATSLVLIGIVSLQVGAAVAKDLFTLVPPTAVVLLRTLTAAVVLVLVCRPRLTGRTRGDWLVVLGFGACLVLMNVAIYQAMARIPLGTAVTIEFLGPLVVAVLGSRRWLDLLWAGLAGLGVALLGFDPSGLDPLGVGFALLAAGCWACYILLGVRTGRRWSGASGLAVASVVGVLVLSGPAVVGAGADLLRPEVLLVGLAVGLLSSVVPYSLELSALRRMSPRVFGIWMSLEPAAAALAGWVLLGERLTPTQGLALGCVVLASVGVNRSSPGAGRTGLRTRLPRRRRRG